MEELRVEDTQSFFSYASIVRMEPAVFNELAQRVMGPRIEKHDTKMRARLQLGTFRLHSSSYRQFPASFEVHSS